MGLPALSLLQRETADSGFNSPKSAQPSAIPEVASRLIFFLNYSILLETKLENADEQFFKELKIVILFAPDKLS